MGLARLASLVAILIPGVRLADIRRASRMLEEDRSLRCANDAVVEFMLWYYPRAGSAGEPVSG
jgi:hypothetical protein